MKFKEIMVERNFRISNDDPYLKEKIFAIISLDDGEDEQRAMLLARDKIVQNFKAAYPEVYTHLNFDEVRQIGDNYGNGSLPLPKDYIDTSNIKIELPKEKINKGTIEEQIEACKTVTELNSFTLIAGMNKKYQEKYHRKLKELQP